MALVVYGYFCYEIKFCGVHEYYLFFFFCSLLTVGLVCLEMMVIA